MTPLVPLLGLLLLSATPADPPPAADHDCGLHALYTWLNLLDKPAEFQQLRQGLAVPESAGYSVGELVERARELGISTEVRSIGVDPKALDRPMIAFLDRDDGGHFIVVRPVGHSGNLVQVFDSLAPPRVIDCRSVVADPTWTGYVIQAGRPPFGLWASILSGSVGLVILLRGRLRGLIPQARPAGDCMTVC